MSNSISNNQLESNLNDHETKYNNSFNELVLTYLKKNQPDGELVQLLNEMKDLSPEIPVTMQKLSSALLYSDTILRSDPDYISYTSDTLDKRTNQMLGLNMLINIMLNNMLNNISHHYDEDENKYFL